ncbi:hypothetical protein BKN38_02630 [Helicobacter sp. CLO-3]|nr:hypothetical protein BA723_09555 [Helicobacter sp. CLO-3]OHU84696.1 hypothetical protein BKN38_02630 [Helicobacter sp. CLO-3]
MAHRLFWNFAPLSCDWGALLYTKFLHILKSCVFTTLKQSRFCTILSQALVIFARQCHTAPAKNLHRAKLESKRILSYNPKIFLKKERIMPHANTNSSQSTHTNSGANPSHTPESAKKACSIQATPKGVWLALAVFLVFFLSGIYLGTQFSSKTDANMLRINQELSTERKITPDTFSADIRIASTERLKSIKTLSAENQDKILAKLNAINKLVAESKAESSSDSGAKAGADSSAKSSPDSSAKPQEICSDGAYSFAPSVYTISKRVGSEVITERVSGYEVSQNISCEFRQDQKAAYEKLINGVRTLVADDEYLQVFLPKITPIITPEQSRSYTQSMRDDLLAKAYGVAKEYGKILHTKCVVTNLSFTDYNNMPKARVYASQSNLKASAMSDSSYESAIEAAMPTTKEDTLSLGARFDIGCEI